jgi:hypothetical protein
MVRILFQRAIQLEHRQSQYWYSLVHVVIFFLGVANGSIHRTIFVRLVTTWYPLVDFSLNDSPLFLIGSTEHLHPDRNGPFQDGSDNLVSLILQIFVG